MVAQLKMIAVALLVSAAALTGAYHVGKHHQRQQAAVETAQAITKAIQNRAGVNETINNMDSVRLCLELGGVREQCGQLRGLAADQP
ncbi:hypothetical protein [Pseudochrobactrum sp. MP213Fo]|uniref:hypothetical protein n=1 Tax=Pseudochrobactrum sp. MP213Fo TaxID=3022250 RepID=UPI003BA1025A